MTKLFLAKRKRRERQSSMYSFWLPFSSSFIFCFIQDEL